MATREVQPPFPKGNTKNFTWDFISDLLVGETITSATVVVNVYSGNDASSSSMVDGAASISGTIVTQLLNASTAGVLGVIYEAVCTVGTSLGQSLTHASFIVVVPTSP